MRWKTGRRSRNIEDIRHSSGRSGLRLPIGKKGGLSSIVIILVAMYFGVDPALFLGGTGDSSVTSAPSRPPSAEENQLADFVSVVLADTEDTWQQLFRNSGAAYKEPVLVLFRGEVRSACGRATASVGPFYCPANQKVYIDLSFYEDLKRRHNAPGDFAQAYVIAHEVGHHVQNLIGVSTKVHQARSKMSQVEGNKLSVKQELQADCFAGIWAHHANRSRQVLETGDIEEALNAASAIGDDTLQKQATGYVRPESFTHGSAEQRVAWFSKGLKTGSVDDCNIFAAGIL